MRCYCTTSLPTAAGPRARGASLSYALVAALGFAIAWSLSKGAGLVFTAGAAWMFPRRSS
ncbi:hypothetical protein DBP12_15740 [Streptomyces sp. CS014]|uniref:Uncharacterized protein n=1 Tax=Streptomyces parvus TaxID=66428 RepID=A0A5D4JF94_9ACTN|nr:hypothetical protein DBP12_15740 [Streptomyces sp. CS014]TYR63566.1 hypothetical protein FY004_16175 [Streptomyces parvus]